MGSATTRRMCAPTRGLTGLGAEVRAQSLFWLGPALWMRRAPAHPGYVSEKVAGGSWGPLRAQWARRGWLCLLVALGGRVCVSFVGGVCVCVCVCVCVMWSDGI